LGLAAGPLCATMMTHSMLAVRGAAVGLRGC
jgi:hypothetical protein